MPIPSGTAVITGACVATAPTKRRFGHPQTAQRVRGAFIALIEEIVETA